MVILALTPLLASMYSLSLASKLICSIMSLAKFGTYIISFWVGFNLASCSVIFLATEIFFG